MDGLTVYTVILNHYDILRPPEIVNSKARYICFSDVPMPKVDPWEIQPCPQLLGDPSRDSRIPKLLPHLVPQLMDSDCSIYCDGALSPRCDPFDLVERRLKNHDIAMYRHPCRECVYQEAAVCMTPPPRGIGMDPGPLQEQVNRYRAEGHPEYWGLWAGGVIIRRHTDMIARLNEDWWRNFIQGSTRDQIAFPPALRPLCIGICTMPGDIMQCQDFQFRMHADFREFTDNPPHMEWRDREKARLGRLREVCLAHTEVTV